MFDSDQISWLTFLGGIALATFILLRIFFRKQRLRRQEQLKADLRPRGSRAEKAGAAHPLLGAPPELQRWQVEMHEAAREMKAELDSKMSALSSLIRLADQSRQALEETLSQAGRPAGRKEKPGQPQ